VYSDYEKAACPIRLSELTGFSFCEGARGALGETKSGTSARNHTPVAKGVPGLDYDGIHRILHCIPTIVR
jgi:hypothetical protein